jgi:hypothetical protein
VLGADSRAAQDARAIWCIKSGSSFCLAPIGRPAWRKAHLHVSAATTVAAVAALRRGFLLVAR